MRYRAKKQVNLGDGHILTEGMTVDLPPGCRLPGLEPVLERDPPANAIEHEDGERSLEAPGRGLVVSG